MLVLVGGYLQGLEFSIKHIGWGPWCGSPVLPCQRGSKLDGAHRTRAHSYSRIAPCRVGSRYAKMNAAPQTPPQRPSLLVYQFTPETTCRLIKICRKCCLKVPKRLWRWHTISSPTHRYNRRRIARGLDPVPSPVWPPYRRWMRGQRLPEIAARWRQFIERPRL